MTDNKMISTQNTAKTAICSKYTKISVQSVDNKQLRAKSLQFANCMQQISCNYLCFSQLRVKKFTAK